MKIIGQATPFLGVVVTLCLLRSVAGEVADVRTMQGDDVPYPLARKIPKSHRVRGGGAAKAAVKSQTREERELKREIDIEIESEVIANNRRELRRIHEETTGGELTERDIDEAISEAHSRVLNGVDNDGGDAQKRLFDRENFRFVKDVNDVHEISAPYFDREGRQWHRSLAASADLVISGNSPGWDHNFGRNEFYCVAIKEIGYDYQPQEGTGLVLRECYRTRQEMIALTYASKEFVFNGVDGVYWDWCATAANPKKSKLFVAHCDVTNPLQLWNLFNTDSSGTWRPDIDASRCVSAGKKNEKLKLKKCSDKDKKREAQTWVYCRQVTACAFDSDTNLIKVDCKLENVCPNRP